jgi:hypothetical protein
LTARRLTIASAFGVAVVLVAVACGGPTVRTVAKPVAGPATVEAKASSGPFIDIPATARPAAEPAAPAAVALLQPAAPAAVAVLQPAAAVKWLPSGKGMWIYLPAATEGGNASAIVAKAKAAGLTHLWVRMGSAWDGFNVVPFVNQLLPVAHAAGIKVIGWDFPKLEPVDADIQRAVTMIRHTTPSGDRIDAFSADIETRSEGTRLTPEAARAYGAALRAAVGDAYPLIATVPRPSKERASFPYGDVTASYDAIAPMVYWLNRQPDTDVAGALRDLAALGKPVFPVGQAYDGAAEGGRKGVPPPDELQRFMTSASAHGATSVSFWSWQHANEPAWAAITGAPEFRIAADASRTITIPVENPSA